MPAMTGCDGDGCRGAALCMVVTVVTRRLALPSSPTSFTATLLSRVTTSSLPTHTWSFQSVALQCTQRAGCRPVIAAHGTLAHNVGASTRHALVARRRRLRRDLVHKYLRQLDLHPLLAGVCHPGCCYRARSADDATSRVDPRCLHNAGFNSAVYETGAWPHSSGCYPARRRLQNSLPHHQRPRNPRHRDHHSQKAACFCRCCASATCRLRAGCIAAAAPRPGSCKPPPPCRSHSAARPRGRTLGSPTRRSGS